MRAIVTLLIFGFWVLQPQALAQARSTVGQNYVGQIKLVFGTYCPQGWFEANGQILEVSRFSTLFAVIGARFGGDGHRTFALPDFRARTPLGTGASDYGISYQLGQAGGDPRALTVEEMPAHSHQVVAATQPPDSPDPRGALPPTAASGQLFYTDRFVVADSVTFSANTIATQGNPISELNTYHPVLAVRYCIVQDGVFPPRP